jgi:hypothetical protein
MMRMLLKETVRKTITKQMKHLLVGILKRWYDIHAENKSTRAKKLHQDSVQSGR